MYIVIDSSITFAYDQKENNLKNVYSVVLGNYRITIWQSSICV